MEFVLGEQIVAAEVHQVPTRGNSMLFTTKLLPSDELLNQDWRGKGCKLGYSM